jgi:hypothetical protein
MLNLSATGKEERRLLPLPGICSPMDRRGGKEKTDLETKQCALLSLPFLLKNIFLRFFF